MSRRVENAKDKKGTLTSLAWEKAYDGVMMQ